MCIRDRSSTTKLSKEVLAGDWNQYGIELLEHAISNRVSYAQSLSDGVSVYQTGDVRAKSEIDAIVNELEGKKWL